jgi:hypothetical protein
MTEITVDDVARSERVRAVTDNLFFWQGRRFIALGPVLIVAGFIANARLDLRVAGSLLAAAIAGALIVSAVIGRRYRAEFGSVRPIAGADATRSQAKWLLACPAMLASLALDILYHDTLPLFVSGFVWAAALALYRRSTGGGRPHYLVLAACLAGLGLAPLATGIDGLTLVSVMMLVLGTGHSAAVLLDDDEMREMLRGG